MFFDFVDIEYTNGPSVKNSAGSYVCSGRKYGSLDWAKNECDKDPKCDWLHDWGCDNKNWRFCSGVQIDGHKGYGGCSKIKPSNAVHFNVFYVITHIPYSTKLEIKICHFYQF